MALDTISRDIENCIKQGRSEANAFIVHSVAWVAFIVAAFALGTGLFAVLSPVKHSSCRLPEIVQIESPSAIVEIKIPINGKHSPILV